jgi:hypothetical integral membrane protein (TIGR02206 family)
MAAYFAYQYSGKPFVQLGAAHIAALLVIFGLVVALWRVPLEARQRRVVRLSLAALLVANELFWHFWHAYYGQWSVQYLLPLNICNLMVFASAWTLLTNNQTGYEFIYLLGVPAASQVLITPALGPYGFPHALFFQIFISHGGVVVAALYLTLVERMRPASWGAVRRVAVWTTLYAIAIFFFNRAVGGNYLFLAYKPPAATLLDYLGPWPWYWVSMEAIGLALVVTLYLPFHWAVARKAVKDKF